MILEQTKLPALAPDDSDSVVKWDDGTSVKYKCMAEKVLALAPMIHGTDVSNKWTCKGAALHPESVHG